MRFASAAAAFTVCGSAGLQAQTGNLLPPPTGPAAIGRVTYHWVDSSRVDPLTAGAPSREVMVDVWYPAAHGARPPVAYFPHTGLVQQALPDSVLRRRYAPMYAAVMAGSVTPHAVDGVAALCPASGCPLLVFSHGGGVDRSAYTFQYEDLASHGYVVAAVAHPRLTHTLVSPDGRVVRGAVRPRELMSDDSTIALWRRQIAASAAWGMMRYRVAAADVRFVIDRMTDLSKDASSGAPFHGRIDLQRIGALGHSMGGLAATLACATDTRIKACLNQDGTHSALTVVTDSGGRALSQPFLYFGRVEPAPPPSVDSVLARIQMTRVEEDSLATLRPRQHDSVFTALQGGAWRLRLRTPGAKHMSFSDEPLVETAGDSARRAATVLAVEVIRRYTRAFFDRTLRGLEGTPLDRPEPGDSGSVSVERFPAGVEKALPRAAVIEDLDTLRAVITRFSAYRFLNRYPYERHLDSLRRHVPDSVSLLDFWRSSQILVGRLQDAHSNVVLPQGVTAPVTGGQLPFALTFIDTTIIALDACRCALLAREHPRLHSIDGIGMDSLMRIAGIRFVGHSPQRFRYRALGALRPIESVLALAGRPVDGTVHVGLAGTRGDTTMTLKVAARVPAPPVTRIVSAELLGEIAYLRIPLMVGPGDAGYEMVRAALESETFRRAPGVILDVRGNEGGTRDILELILPRMIRQPLVYNVALVRADTGGVGERSLRTPEDARLAPAVREAIRVALASFRPGWEAPPGEFLSQRFASIVLPSDSSQSMSDKPVVVLMDAGSFSATDIFLGAMDLAPNVTLMGTPSAGGSGRSRTFVLPRSGLRVVLSTMASFRPDGRFYDGAGVAPDIMVAPTLDGLASGQDTQLAEAVRYLTDRIPARR